MSLINDALKRASQTHKSQQADSPLQSPMQPVAESKRSPMPIVIAVIAVLLLAVAGWLAWRSYGGSKAAPPVVAVAPAIPAPPVRTVVKAEPVVVPAPVVKVEPPPAPKPEPVVTSIPVSAPVAVVVSNPPVAPAAPVTPVVVAPDLPFPELKVQAILYSRRSPKTIINGQSRSENDMVGEVRIVKIAATKVTVEWNGQTKDLTLDGQ